MPTQCQCLKDKRILLWDTCNTYGIALGKETKMKYYALTLENEIRLIIPWKETTPPTPIEFCQAISSVWAKSGPDFSFGKPPKIEEFYLNTSME